MYKEDFKNFIESINKEVAGAPENNKIYAKFAQEIKDKRTFFELQRKSEGSCIQDSNLDNQMFQLFIRQKNSKIPALPILFKIQQGKLRLQEYQLSPAQCDSLCEVLD